MKSAIALALLVSACSSVPPARRFTGPEGNPDWWFLSCPGDKGECLQLAGLRCAHGYEQKARSSRTLVVRCNGPSSDPPPESDECTHTQPHPMYCDEQTKMIREWTADPPKN